MTILKPIAWLIALALSVSVARAADPPPAVFREGARIVFQGDSITDGGRERSGAHLDHQLGHGYPYLIAAQYTARFPERKLVFFNRGISGHKLSDLVARWPADTIALKPDVISILIGVNDVWHNLGARRPIRYDEIEAAYDKLIVESQNRLPGVKIVLCEPFILKAGATKDRWDEWNAAVTKIREIVARLGAKHKLPVVHFQKTFDEACRRAPAEYWLFDGVHPYWAGHQLMADAWIRTVKEAWGE